jgi:hypothetical protein
VKEKEIHQEKIYHVGVVETEVEAHPRVLALAMLHLHEGKDEYYLWDGQEVGV